MSSNTAVARREETPRRDPKRVALALMGSSTARQFIEPVLPKGVSYDEFSGLAALAIYKNPDILRCTAESIVFALADIARLDLVPGHTAFVVPFKEKKTGLTKATMIVGYKGLIELVMVRTRAARLIDAEVVYEHDEFDHDRGRGEIHHRQAPSATRGRLIGAWAKAVISQGINKTLYMDVAEIDAIRQGYSKFLKDGPLEATYCRKTVIRAICDKLPQNTKLLRVLADVDKAEQGEYAETSRVTALDLHAADEEPQRLNPAYPGRALADAGDSPFDPDRQPTGLGVPRRTITETDRVRPDAGTLAQYQDGPDEYGYGTDELPPVDEAFDDVAQAEGSTGEASRTPAAAPASTSAPPCPSCGGSMYDNRLSKRTERTPDFKCKDPDCNKAIWLDKARR